MGANFELKKLFIKDEELTKIEDDKLGSKDITANIEMIIDNTKPPFAIALTGKSGMGKSSIINMLVEKYNGNTQDCDDYSIKKINVWKDERNIKDILSDNNSANSDLAENNNIMDKNGNISSIKNQNSTGTNNGGSTTANNEKNSKNNNHNGTSKSSKLQTLKKIAKVIFTFIVCFLITSIMFVFIQYMGNEEIYSQDNRLFVKNAYWNYRDNIGMILVFAFGLTVIAYIIGTIRLATKRALEKKAAKKVHSNTNGVVNINNAIIDNNLETDKKNIIIIEDIDKLTANKMLENLEDIKYCNLYGNCILIVPFDETVISKAINVKNKFKVGANYRPLNFEKILEKIFQFKVCVPYISSGDIKDYAVNLVKETVPDFIARYCKINVFERVIRDILIYKNIMTPREVKKLINNFINNKILIVNRVRNGRINKSLITEKKFDMQLAKICVIQSEFEEFYDVLFKDFDYLQALTELYCLDPGELRNVFVHINEDLKPFFAPKYKSLANFLRKTKNCKIDNMPTIMYNTKVKTEKMYKGKSVLGFILGDEDISELRIQEVLELVKLLEGKEELKEFTVNNFDKLLERFKDKSSNKIFFVNINQIVNIIYQYIDQLSYIKFLEIVAENYNCYPQEALDMFKSIKIEIPVSVMNILIIKVKDSLSKENYDETFEFLRENSEGFFEENGRISDYVQFLVNYIGLASNPNEIITELNDNFTRIGKIYELNKNIKQLENVDYNMAYEFIASCIDNGNFNKMINVMNSILSDEDSVEDCLNIEEKMSNYKLIDLIECNVDELIESDESAELLGKNYILLKNLIELCTVKQDSIAPDDSIKIIEKALKNTDDSDYILEVYEILKQFDKMYFYEIRKEFNEIIYSNFHYTENIEVKKKALDCTRYFRSTRLFLTMLNEAEKSFIEKIN